jgi:LacI family transcriptional regulator
VAFIIMLLGKSIKNPSNWKTMPHHFLVKDIAHQAGLSTATVDRVLNKRDGVRQQTQMRVEAAINELERQEVNLSRTGKSHVIDIVMEAPDRFSHEVREAFESEAGAFYPALFRPRFQFSEQIEPVRFVQLLDRIRIKGSNAVVVKGPDVPELQEAVNRLMAANIPVFTLVTDLSHTKRLAYAGMNNEAAGDTAAWLIARTVRSAKARVLVLQSSLRFRGEGDRVAAFEQALLKRHPHLTMTIVSEGYGKDAATSPLIAAALKAHPDIVAVYSSGGGNRAVIAEFDRQGRSIEAFVAHDLDEDNRALLAAERIHFVLSHSLKTDVRYIYEHLLGRGKGGVELRNSAITVHTPFNMA